MSSPFVAEIRFWAGNFAPTGYALCAGQLLPISQNTALFSLLGTFYGGDGKSTFALPDLQDNVPVNQGQSTTGTQYFIGEQSGVPYVTLLTTEMPVHTHNMGGSFNTGDLPVGDPNSVLTKTQPGSIYQTTSNQQIVQFAPQMIGIAGGSQPHNNMMPFLVLTAIIALQGIFPPRS
ncbi:MAG TPA: tail fiber protein [Thermoanaerobaculia bacterium]|jgi:microcystin-dependent protein|nr:tail fiber protein [Thermoanaerobaculia bacterium]